MKIPILADTNHSVSKAYGCLKEDEGIAFRGLYIIDAKGKYWDFMYFYVIFLNLRSLFKKKEKNMSCGPIFQIFRG